MFVQRKEGGMKQRKKEKLERWYIRDEEGGEIKRKEGRNSQCVRACRWMDWHSHSQGGQLVPGGSQASQTAAHWPCVTWSPPWPAEIPRHLPPSQMFKVGGSISPSFDQAHAGELQHLVEEITSSLPRQGVPWRWSWASAAQTGNPGGGEGRRAY